MKLFQKILFWIAAGPILLSFWSGVGWLVHKSDQTILIYEVVTEETVEEIRTKIDALWMDYEERMGVEE